MFQVGDKIRDYEIVARLKAGGMATLFLGRRVGAAGFARHVAIKVVHPHLSTDRTFVEMFLDEARLSSNIHHPNVVHVEELGQFEGNYYLVMEYVRGCSLSQFERALARRNRRMSPELATYVAIKVAEGLHAAHEATNDEGHLLQVVHRDVSPQNVLLAYRGHVKLIDFGIAKAHGRSQQTTARSLKGKLRYMAPEQAWGRDVDRRTDVYALGIVLWEMLTMRRLFSGADDFALLEEVRKPYVVAPSSVADGISPALDEAVLSALQPKRADRPATAKELRAMLVAAMPSSAALDASNLSDLLRIVMADDIVKEQRALPESVSQVLDDAIATSSGLDDADAVNTMTMQSIDSDLGSGDDDDYDAVEIEGIPASGSGSLPTSGRARLAWAVGLLVLLGGAIAIGRYTASRDTEPAEVAAPPQPAVDPEPVVEPEPPIDPPQTVEPETEAADAEMGEGSSDEAAAEDAARRAEERRRALDRQRRRDALRSMPMESVMMDAPPAMTDGVRMVGDTYIDTSDPF